MVEQSTDLSLSDRVKTITRELINSLKSKLFSTTFIWIFIFFFIIYLVIFFIIFLMNTSNGCKDMNAINYNSGAFFHNQDICKYSKNIKPVISGCTQPWSFNYNVNATKDDNSCIGTNTLLNLLNIYSSQKGSIVLINDKIVIDNKDNGLHIIFIDRKINLPVKDVQYFNISNSYDEIDRMVDYLRSVNDEIVIIVSSGKTFTQFNNNKTNKSINNALNVFKSIGGLNTNFNEYTNYILVGSTKNDVYFEWESVDDIYFPKIKLVNNLCKINSANYYPPKDYIFFKDINSNEEYKTKCALEAHRKGYNQFGLVYDKCVIMDDEEYDRFEKLPHSSKCQEGLGTFDSISGYKFTIGENIKDMTELEWGVTIYDNSNFKGNMTVLNFGDYNLNDYFRIKSIDIPKKMYVILSIGEEIFSLYGPYKTNINKNYDNLIIRNIYDKNVIFCNNLEGNGQCFIYGIGKHSLNRNEYFKIQHINASSNVSKIIIYEDSNFINKIAEFNTNTNNNSNNNNRSIYKIKYPRIIRSIQIE